MTRLLVVDDSATMTDLLYALFTGDGHDVVRCNSGFPELLEPDCPLWIGVDMLVTDLNLGTPGFTGLDILEHCERRHPLIRRAVLSGAAMQPELYEPALRLAHVVLPKPTLVEDLLKVVRMQVEERLKAVRL